MFEDLTRRLDAAFKGLLSRGVLTEADVDAGLREVRLALLEADVNFKVARDFVAGVRAEAVGETVLRSVTPGQQVVKIVHDHMVELLGGENHGIAYKAKPPTVIMTLGLQGSGKTTTAAKLALLIRKQGHQPLLVGADVHRPGAKDQLEVLSRQVDIVYFTTTGSAEEIAAAALEEAGRRGLDVVIIDTAGRLQLDQEMLDEVRRIRSRVDVDECLLVVDAMTGQDAVNVAESFAEAVQFDGVVLSKLDGDARGGAALSVKAVTGKPILFASTGEKLDQFERFHPDRIAQRILGMGDVMTLIEKAEQEFDEEEARELERKLRRNEFGLDDFLEQMRMMRKLGPLSSILGMIPGFGGHQLQSLKIDERELDRIQAIILSMTPEERRRPELIKGSRRLRIARGSGANVQQVNRLVKQFDQMRKVMRQVGRGKMPDIGAMMRNAR